MSDLQLIQLAVVVEDLADWVATLAEGSDFDNADEMAREIRKLAKNANRIARDV